jgi:ABC-type polysaccharide/polyol phosphate export permease
VKVRYKQAVLGIAWAIIQPLMTVVIFSVVFGQLANLPSEGIPYPVFSYAALLPWQLFSGALTRSGSSLVGNATLLTKVYFPRLIIPLSASMSGLIDFSISCSIGINALLRHFTHLGDSMVTIVGDIGFGDGFVGWVVVICIQCSVSGCTAHHSIYYTSLDVWFSRGLFN